MGVCAPGLVGRVGVRQTLGFPAVAAGGTVMALRPASRRLGCRCRNPEWARQSVCGKLVVVGGGQEILSHAGVAGGGCLWLAEAQGKTLRPRPSSQGKSLRTEVVKGALSEPK